MATSASSLSSLSPSSSSMSNAFPQPLRLIETDSDGRFSVVADTAALLSRVVTQPMVVVAVAGRYRTGKSFLMNRLAGSNSGFPMGCTVQSDTKGIWVWPRPHPLRSDWRLLLIDTEGLGDVESAGRAHDTWLFMMAVLLSTTLVYNVMGTLDKECLEQLHFVVNMTEHVRTRVNQHEDDRGSDFEHYFPPLVICVRDVTLKLILDGEPCTADEYLEHCLKKRKKGSTLECRQFNEQRMLLCEYFKDRKCFMFPTPIQREKLEVINSLPDESLDAEFLATAEELREHVLRRAEVKRVDDAVLSGQSFVLLVEQYVRAQRDGAVPCIESAIEQVAALTNQRAKEAALALYTERTGRVTEQLLPLPTAELSRMHQQAVEEAVGVFHKSSLLDRKRKHEEELMEALAKKLLKFLEENKKASSMKCEQRLEELHKPIRRKIQDGAFMQPGAFLEYERLMQQLRDAYHDTQGLCDEKEKSLTIFMKSKEEEKYNLLMQDKTLSLKKREWFENEFRERKKEQEIRTMKEQNALQEAHLKALNAQMKANEKAFEEKIRHAELLAALKANVSSKPNEPYKNLVEAMQPMLKQLLDYLTIRSALSK